MWFVIGGFILIALFTTYALLKSASDADDEIDKMIEKEIHI